jgi:hypothetical protein
LKLLKENFGKVLQEISKCIDFLKQHLIVQEIGIIIGKWNFIKLKSLYTTKEIAE